MTDLLKEIKAKVDEFFNKATDEDIVLALKEANYEVYTGINPDTLSLHKPITNYSLTDRYLFSYSADVSFGELTNYVLCFDCYASEADNYDTPYLKAA